MNEFERLRRSILINQGDDPRSYWISTTGVKSYFDLENTPMANFTSTGSTVTINSVSVTKTDISKLVFGDSYNSITGISNYFLYNYNYLTYVGLSGLKNLVTAGSVFLSGNYYMTSLDLSTMPGITQFGNQPFSSLYSLSSIKIGSKDYSLVTAPNNGFQYAQNSSSCTIYAGTVALANAFKAKFPNLNNWSVAVG